MNKIVQLTSKAKQEYIDQTISKYSPSEYASLVDVYCVIHDDMKLHYPNNDLLEQHKEFYEVIQEIDYDLISETLARNILGHIHDILVALNRVNH